MDGFILCFLGFTIKNYTKIKIKEEEKIKTRLKSRMNI